MTEKQTFTERALERGYRIVEHDGWRDVTKVRDGKVYGLDINSTIDPDHDMWEAILDQWDDYLFRGVA